MLQIDPPAVSMSDDLEVLRDAALGGLGMVWLPDWLLRPHFCNGTLSPVLAGQRAFRLETYLVRPNTIPTRRLQIVSDGLASEMRQRLNVRGRPPQ